MGFIVPVASKGDGKLVLRRNVLCINLDEASCEVGWMFRTWLLDYYEIVNLATWNDVKGKGA